MKRQIQKFLTSLIGHSMSATCLPPVLIGTSLELHRNFIGTSSRHYAVFSHLASRFINRAAGILLLLTLGLGFSQSVWGKNFKDPYIYFNNADLEWNPAMLLVGHNDNSGYSAGYNQTSNPLANTKLVYFHPSASWTDQTGFTIGQASGWEGQQVSFDTRVGYLSTRIGTQWNYDFNENDTYYVTGTSGDNKTISVTYYKDGHSALPKTTATIQVQTRNSTGDYTTLTSNAPAIVTLQGTHMSGNGTTGRNSVTWDGEKEYNVVITGKVTTSYSNMKSNYQFDGWYIGSSQEGTGTSYEYYQSSATTVIAKFTRIKYAVTFDKQSGTGGSSSVTATYDSDMPSATMPTRDGYDFGGYYTEQNGAGTKYYNADGTSAKTCDLTSDITLYAKWTIHNYAITYDPLKTAENKHFTYASALDNATYNTSVAMEFTPDANYVIASVKAHKNG